MHTVCAHLGISRFSVLAHSAGAIYALALALRMPQHIRGRIHLLAPWIPPSQLTTIGVPQRSQADADAADRATGPTALPYAQRFLRSLPTPFLKAANSGFFALTSNSFTSLPNAPKRTPKRSVPARRRSLADPAELTDAKGTGEGVTASAPTTPAATQRGRGKAGIPPNAPRTRSATPTPAELAADAAPAPAPSAMTPSTGAAVATPASPRAALDPSRQAEYDARLTHGIWARATTGASPAVDLLVCLERRAPIGFRYADVAKSVVMHHGARDSRVPPDNVRWLARTMRRCEVRVLDGEGHGLMASAGVMAGVLGEIAREWEDWYVVTGRREKR